MKLRRITQRDTLALIRKPLPPATRVILDRKTKSRARRPKHPHPLEP